MSLSVNARRILERFGDIDFWKWNQGVFFNVNTSRRLSFGGRFFGGDQVFFRPGRPVPRARDERRIQCDAPAGRPATV